MKLKKTAATTAVVSAMSVLSNPSAAYNFTIGDVKGSVSSTLTYGASWRLGHADRELAATGGNPNFDPWDLVSNRVTGSHELELKRGAMGLFVRGTYFYDNANDELDPGVPGLVDASESDEDSVADWRFLDAYIYDDFRLAGGTLNVRYGEQAISWGESTFIGGSLNDINTLDVTKLRQPGAELKNALMPNLAAYANWSSTAGLTVEAFYLFDFDQIRLDSAGTFWNTNTAVADGGLRLGPRLRAQNNYAKDSGQYGGALRYYLGHLGAGTEVALYYHNLHSHAPILSGSRPLTGAGRYFLDYPENIRTWGASFNTLLGSWAWSGEWSHRANEPLQTTGFFFAAPGTTVRGYERIKRDQIQTTFQKVLSPRLIKADTGSFLAEVGYTNLGNRPESHLRASPLNSVALNPVTNSAWGYVFSLSATYNRAIANVINLTPNLSFRHDVDGVAGPFIEDAKALTVGLNWEYLLMWTGSVSITHNFDGSASKNNLTGGVVRADEDRNWLSVSVSYQF
jgi:hypothetical protein